MTKTNARRRGRLPQKTLDDLRDMIARNYSANQIATRLGIHYDSVIRFAQMNGLTVARRKSGRPGVSMNYGYCKVCRARVVMPCLACLVRKDARPAGYATADEEPTLRLEEGERQRYAEVRRMSRLNWNGESAQ